MSDEARADPTWVYWKARALLAAARRRRRRAPRPQKLLESIASLRGFYEQLALEELGQQITVPPRPRAAHGRRKGSRPRQPRPEPGLHAIALGLRPEGVREWNYATNMAKPGGMAERELLAAAQLACEREVWDRCINTSERTKAEFDVEQRFPMPFREAVVRRSQEIGLDPAYVYGLIRQESRFVMDARSHVGASGLMQVMPATARWTARKIGMTDFAPDQLNDRDTNIAIGTGYLKLVLDDFDGSMPLAAAAYNAGPGRPRSWRNGPVIEAAAWAENVPFNETRDYVKKVLSNTTIYAAILTRPAAVAEGAAGHGRPARRRPARTQQRSALSRMNAWDRIADTVAAEFSDVRRTWKPSRARDAPAASPPCSAGMLGLQRETTARRPACARTCWWPSAPPCSCWCRCRPACRRGRPEPRDPGRGGGRRLPVRGHHPEVSGSEDQVRGLTTAAGIWLTAAIGIAAGWAAR